MPSEDRYRSDVLFPAEANGGSYRCGGRVSFPPSQLFASTVSTLAKALLSSVMENRKAINQNVSQSRKL